MNMTIQFCSWCLKSIEKADIKDVRKDRCPYCGEIGEINDVLLELPKNAELIQLKEDIVLAKYNKEFVTWSLSANVDGIVGVTYGHYYSDLKDAKKDFNKRLETVSFIRYLPKTAEPIKYDFKTKSTLVKFIDVDNVEKYATWRVHGSPEEANVRVSHGCYFSNLEEATSNFLTRIFET